MKIVILPMAILAIIAAFFLGLTSHQVFTGIPLIAGGIGAFFLVFTVICMTVKFGKGKIFRSFQAGYKPLTINDMELGVEYDVNDFFVNTATYALTLLIKDPKTNKFEEYVFSANISSKVTGVTQELKKVIVIQGNALDGSKTLILAPVQVSYGRAWLDRKRPESFKLPDWVKTREGESVVPKATAS